MSDEIKINVTVNGKEVPLAAISMETIGKIRDAEKEEPVYIGAIFRESGWSDWMLIYDYAADGLNFLCITKTQSNCGRTYTSNVLKGAITEFVNGVSEKEIKRGFNYIQNWKLIERGRK